MKIWRLGWNTPRPVRIFSIYFDDLKKECQRELLKFYGVDKPEDMNWDVVPVVTLEGEG